MLGYPRASQARDVSFVSNVAALSHPAESSARARAHVCKRHQLVNNQVYVSFFAHDASDVDERSVPASSNSSDPRPYAQRASLADDEVALVICRMHFDT